MDGQDDIKESSIVNFVVDFQSQSNPAEVTPVLESFLASSVSELKNTLAIVHNFEGVKRKSSDKFDSVKKPKK